MIRRLPSFDSIATTSMLRIGAEIAVCSSG